MDNWTIINEWLRDSAIGFLLIIAGFGLAELLKELFQTSNPMAYSCFLCIGIIPFVWFAAKRLGRKIGWQYAAWFGFIIAMSGIQMFLESHLGTSRFSYVLTLTIGFACFGWLMDSVSTWMVRDKTNESGAR